MAKSIVRKTAKREESCFTCGELVPPGLIHCNGSKAAYGCREIKPHHGSVLWPNCWKCGAGMGCSHCVPGGQDENWQPINNDLICKPCRVKANLLSLLNGGPISKFTLDMGNKQIFWGMIHKHTPGLEEYPADWRLKYAQQRIKFGLPLDVSDEEAIQEVCRGIADLIAGVGMPQELSKRQRQENRNRQVAMLSGGVLQHGPRPRKTSHNPGGRHDQVLGQPDANRV